MDSEPDLLPMRCAVTWCDEQFKSEFEREQHYKDNDDCGHQRHYCKKCHEAFDDNEALVDHKLQSKRHAVCVHCHEELRNDSFFGIHYKQNAKCRIAAAQSKLECAGCQKTFDQAARYIGHIEQGRCRNKQHPERAFSVPFLKSCLQKQAEIDRIGHKNLEKSSVSHGLQTLEFHVHSAPMHEAEDRAAASSGNWDKNVRLTKTSFKNISVGAAEQSNPFSNIGLGKSKADGAADWQGSQTPIPTVESREQTWDDPVQPAWDTTTNGHHWDVTRPSSKHSSGKNSKRPRNTASSSVETQLWIEPSNEKMPPPRQPKDARDKRYPADFHVQHFLQRSANAYRCNRCNDLLRDPDEFAAHYFSWHEPERGYFCQAESCYETPFRSLEALVHHLEHKGSCEARVQSWYPVFVRGVTGGFLEVVGDARDPKRPLGYRSVNPRLDDSNAVEAGEKRKRNFDDAQERRKREGKFW